MAEFSTRLELLTPVEDELGTTLRFLERPCETSSVLEWFLLQPNPPEVVQMKRGIALLFRSFGPLVFDGLNQLDQKASPVVGFFPPEIHRGVLFSVGEIHFSTRSKAIPQMEKLARQLRKWLQQYPIVAGQGASTNEFDYYLEGSIRNYDSPVFALPSGLQEIKAGRYFVHDDPGDLLALCQKLRLRDVHCE